MTTAQIFPQVPQMPMPQMQMPQMSVCQIVTSTTIGKGICFPIGLCSYMPNNNNLQQGDCPMSYCCVITSTAPKPLPVCGKKGSTDAKISPRISRIIGGDIPGENEQCWQVAIMDVTNGKYLGGGSLVKENIVVTAAHLLIGKSAAALRVRVGDSDLYSITSCGSNSVIQIIVHPDFKADDFQNDVALLKLDSPVNINSGCACLLCLPNTTDSFKDVVGKSCFVSGFGSTQVNGNELSQYLRTINIRVIEIAECVTAIQKKRKKFVAQPSFICSVGEAGKDTCNGDGGGPLFCDNGSGVFVQYGVISWGLACGTPNMPFVSTQVTAVLTWILQTAESINANGSPGRAVNRMLTTN